MREQFQHKGSLVFDPKQTIIYARTFNRIRKGGQSRKIPEKSPRTRDRRPEDTTLRCYSCATIFLEGTAARPVEQSGQKSGRQMVRYVWSDLICPQCHKVQPSEVHLSSRQRTRVESWREKLPNTDPDGRPICFLAPPSPLVATVGGGQPDPERGGGNSGNGYRHVDVETDMEIWDWRAHVISKEFRDRLSN